MSNAKVSYTVPACSFEDAIPLGNGQIGAMVYGGCREEKISLNHETLWSGLPLKEETGDKRYPYFEKARELALAGEYIKAQEVLEQHFLGKHSETYLPLGELRFAFTLPGQEITEYVRELDLERAVCQVRYRAGGVAFCREYFVSYPDRVFVMKFSCDTPGALQLEAWMDSPLRHTVKAGPDRINLTGECPGQSQGKRPNVVYSYFEEPGKRGIQFGASLKAVISGERKKVQVDRAVTKKDVTEDAATANCAAKSGTVQPVLKICQADEVILYLAAESSFHGYDRHPFLDGKDYEAAIEKTLKQASELGYDALQKRHVLDYQELFGRVRLELGESGREMFPTDERLRAFYEGTEDISLYTLLFDFNRYLVIASSRENTLATNLQGIWNDELQPKWRCNYTTNINTQMNYWPVLPCNMPECYQPLIEFVKMLSKTGKATAANWYGAEGFMAHHNGDIWGITTPTPPVVAGFWQGASGWLASCLYDYYEYTRDEEFLRDTAYPIMKEAALFYLSILVDRGDGKLSLVPSTSPENAFVYGAEGGEKVRCTVSRYTAISDSIALQLFYQCLEAIDALALEDASFAERLKAACSGMDALRIGDDGRLLEWEEAYEEPIPHNGHVSHMYPLYPGRLVTSKTPGLMEACRESLLKRGDAGSGWPVPWRMSLWARLGEGDHALSLLDNQLHYMVVGTTYQQPHRCPNLFAVNFPFQIDVNFGLVSGILDMLVGYDGQQAIFLPALPSKWQNGSLKGVHARDGIVYDIAWKDGKLISCEKHEKISCKIFS